MNDGRIKLPRFLIANLYKHSLVELADLEKHSTNSTQAEGTGVLAKAPSGDICYVGGNGKNVIIIVNQEDPWNVDDLDRIFLINVLKACQLNLADIAIVNVFGQEITFAVLKEQLFAIHILLLDVDPSIIKLPFIIPFFQPQNYAGCSIMLAPALSLLNQSSKEGRLLKTKLWNSLKVLFGMN